MIEAAIDNDVLIKAAAFDLLGDIVACATPTQQQAAVLGTAPYVCARAIQRKPIAGNKSVVQTRLTTFLASVEKIEPTDAETALAAEFEEAALGLSVPLDGGESLLAAVAIIRDLKVILTGDKRAIAALAQVLLASPHAATLAGRLMCFEQAMFLLAQASSCTGIRGSICAEAKMDTAIAICFSCAMPNPATIACEACLQSYIAHARANSGNLLMPVG